MTTNWTKKKDDFGNETLFKIDADGKEWAVPQDESNSDYQRYLRWLNGEDETL